MPTASPRPHSSAPSARLGRRFMQITLAVLIGGPVAGLVGAGSANAQRRPPTAELLALYGRRYVVPVPSAQTGASHTLQISNAGWGPASVAVVAIGSAGSAECPTALAPGQVRSAGCMSVAGPAEPLAANAFVEAPVQAEGATHLMVYSIAASNAQVACADLGRVQTGQMDLAAWERSVFAPGEPIAVALASLAGGSLYTVNAGQPALADMIAGTPFVGNLGAPFVPAGGQARLIAHSADCGMADGRWNSLVGECNAVETFRLPSKPLTSVSLPAKPAGGGYVFSTNRAVSTLIDASDGSGWYTTQMAEVTAESRQLYFPMAGGLVDGLRSELHVTNHHMTATTTIDIFMLGGGGQLVNLYTDPVALCAGGNRAYDVTTLAGTLPGAGRGPVVLALRVTSTNRDLAVAPPISGQIVVQSNLDAASYVGADQTTLLQGFGGRDQPGTPILVVPGVRRNEGQPPLTTVMAVQSTRGGGNSQLYVDFYDERGRLVVDDAYFNIRGDGAAVIDLSRPMQDVGGGTTFNLPDGFRGTAHVRPAAPRENLALVAFDLLRRPADADRAPFAMWEASSVVRLPDPSIPTATATDLPPTEPSATATGRTTPDVSVRVYLPLALNGTAAPNLQARMATLGMAGSRNP